ARKYFQEMGHLAVPNNYVCADGYRLGKWISNQRCAYRGALGRGLEAEQIRQLEEIGMVWSAKPGRHGAKICVK
ncbi:MAG: helicase associated domain-containing protein, partial [Lachnospiraceae bacterium]|nr:helicase associated domain-containing protein [Lachnospiraceae bacterium]